MKVCFYWFNLSTPPGMSVGVSILARELADAGHEVSVLHLNERVGISLEHNILKKHTASGSFDLHALSFGQNHYPAAMELAALIKDAAPNSKILCGGVHTTLNAQKVLEHPAIDFVGLGEVDGLLSRFVDSLESESGYRSIPNFWTKHENKIIRTPMAPLPDITEQSLPFFDGIDYRAIIKANRGFAETIVGRGCPMKCNYCHNAAIVDTYRKLIPNAPKSLGYCRHRSVESVIAELKIFKERYFRDLRAFNFGDDRFASSHDWLRSFARSYSAEIGLPFICNAIAGQIDAEMAQQLADAGCYMVKFGVESGSERVRKEILSRQLSEAKLSETVSALHQRGVNTRAYVMLGMPTETPDEMHATIRLCAGLGFDSVRPAIMYPFPGTELQRYCISKNLIDDSEIPTDYSTTTVLKLPESEKTFIEKTAGLYAWHLNTYLNDDAARASKPLVEKIMDMPNERWLAGDGRDLLARQGQSIHESLRSSKTEHYFSPFADRPDVIFLYRQRTQPLLNVEER
ncbi:MAG: radical SAM protein [Deltaproteobacteria bacterium]|nr:radical SAM protein [Deltaproteobacteria bacterium]